MENKLTHIDKEIGLKTVANMEKLYEKVLKSFVEDFSQINLSNLDDEELNRTIHTLKGLSANIGAIKLNELCIKAHDENNLTLLPNVEDELNQVLKEIKSQYNF